MAVQDLVLHFIYDENSGDKQFYIPGDILRGTIHLHLLRNLRVRSMTLLILGGAAVSWEEQAKKKLYTAREEYLQGSKILLDAGVDDSVELQRGIHEFTFEYQLPSNLPSTFSGVYGSVTYVAKCVLHPEDDHSTTMTSEPFMVLRRPPLPPETYADQEMKASKFFLGFLTAGQVKLQCRISRSAAIPGEIIYVNAEVANWSPKGINLIQGAVILESTYYAQNAKDKKIAFRQILNKRIDVFDVKNLRGRRWRNVQMAIPPYLPDSELMNCAIMDVKYLFEFRAQIQGADDIFIHMPLYVGGQPVGYGDVAGQGPKNIDLDAFSGTFTNNELPWYRGGGGVLTESVDGDMFDVR
ncbi:arrestin domain-containing protein 3-like [Littorina saxatilis]|uniref:Arrestin C-terminal-like domain-containing protein n=1 Tax=Littorina saxatilis TaxID=31220 RepID=A0AAN9B9W5_9CAEN